MHQAVLVHTQIHKRTESRHIADRAFEHHAFAQIAYLFHTFGQARHLEIRPRIAPWLFQLFENILHRNNAHALVGKQLGPQALQHVTASQQRLHRLPGFFQNALNHGIAFRVDAGVIQRIFAAANTQKTSALFKGLSAQTRHLQELLAAGKRALRFAPRNHRPRHRVGQARDA